MENQVYIFESKQPRLIPVASEEVANKICKIHPNYHWLTLDKAEPLFINSLDEFEEQLHKEHEARIEAKKEAIKQQQPLYKVDLYFVDTDVFALTYYIRTSRTLYLDHSVSLKILDMLKKNDYDVNGKNVSDVLYIANVKHIAKEGEEHLIEKQGKWDLTFSADALYQIDKEGWSENE